MHCAYNNIILHLVDDDKSLIEQIQNCQCDETNTSLSEYHPQIKHACISSRSLVTFKREKSVVSHIPYSTLNSAVLKLETSPIKSIANVIESKSPVTRVPPAKQAVSAFHLACHISQ